RIACGIWLIGWRLIGRWIVLIGCRSRALVRVSIGAISILRLGSSWLAAVCVTRVLCEHHGHCQERKKDQHGYSAHSDPAHAILDFEKRTLSNGLACCGSIC